MGRTERLSISACVAVYNGAEHVGKALSAILAQTVQPDEIIVLDDGSTDDSAKIASSFLGVKVLKQENGGIGAARKALVEAASGEWIAFCDHDDWWDENRLEMGLSSCSEDKAALIYSGAMHVDPSGKEIASPLRAAPGSPSIDHVVPNPEDIWTSTTLLRRSAVIEAGNFNPAYRTGEDMLMWFQLAGLGRVVQVPGRPVHMLRREVSTSSPDKRQFEYAVSLYEKEVLPNFDRWFADVEKDKRDNCRRQLEAKLGFKMSLLAAMLDMEGDRAGARELHNKGRRLSPGSKGVWYRYLRHLLHVPANPRV